MPNIKRFAKLFLCQIVRLSQFSNMQETCDYLQKGYMLSFSFNKTKETGLKEIRLGDKILIEAVV